MAIRRTVSLLGMLLVLVLLASACTTVRGSGELRTEERDVRDFSVVELQSLGNLIVEQTGSPSVRVTADDNLISLVETVNEGDTLVLRVRPGVTFDGSRLTFRVTTGDDLAAVNVAGAGDADVSNIDAETIRFRIAGSGEIRANGMANTANVVIGGAGNFNGLNLNTEQISVNIAGSGDVYVNAASQLDVTIGGSGDVFYTGQPAISQRILGSGVIAPYRTQE
jgi:hypothetical protein